MTRAHRAAGLLVVIASMLVACGGDDDQTAGTPAGSTATTSASSPPAATSTDSGAPAPTTAAPGATGAPAAEPAVTFTELASLEAPVDLTWRDGDDGLYVVQQGGQVVRLAPDGETTEVLDVSAEIQSGGEQGLLGLAFAPEEGGLGYLNYTNEEGDTTIAEHAVSSDGSFASADDARILFVIEQPYDNHNGGDLVFGPDGMLYVGMGDGGDAGDPERRATDLSSPLGKLLRIDPTPSEGEQFTIPEDNPFVAQDGVDPRIWSSGLRNPWRFSFDRETGDLWIADVGQGAFEEIDVAPATNGVDGGRGLSFGWSAFEGFERFNEDVPEDGHTPPFATYPHGDGSCSISGGVRARDGSSLDGWYVYADFCTGRVTAQEVLGEGDELSAGRTVELGQVDSPTAVVEGPAGDVYVLSGAGPVLRLDPA